MTVFIRALAILGALVLAWGGPALVATGIAEGILWLRIVGWFWIGAFIVAVDEMLRLVQKEAADA